MSAMLRLKKSSPKSPPLSGDESGFTLLEVIIAISIMVLAMASILSVESNSINATARSKTYNIVAMLARRQLIQTEYEIEGKTFDEVKKEAGGTFEAPYEDFRWTSIVKEVEFPNMIAAGGGGNKDSSGGGGAGGGGGSSGGDIMETIGKLVTQYFSKAIREVTVTIYWKRGEGEQSYAISTYWVDLNHEFELTQ